MGKGKIIGLMMLVVGLYWATIEALSLFKDLIYFHKTKVIKGKVIGYEHIRKKVKDCLIIEYEDEGSPTEKKQYESRKSFKEGKYLIGDIVDLRYYRKGKKDIVFLNRISDYLLIPLLGFLGGCFFILIGIVALFIAE